MIRYLREHQRRLILALGVALYLRFLLMPTAALCYETYHLTGVEAVYWGYSLFKAAGYYFGIWPYQTPACIGVAVLIGVPWRHARQLLQQRTWKRTTANESTGISAVRNAAH